MSPGPGKGPKKIRRPSGGVRSSFGGLNEAGMDGQAMKAAAQQKQVSQQVSDSSQSNTGGSALKTLGENSQDQIQQQEPREVADLKQELIQRPIKDIGKELKKFFDINALLDIHPTEDGPEDKIRKKKMHQRWQKLTQEEQQEAQKRYKKEMERKQKEEEEKERERRQIKAQKKQAIAPPTTPKKGPGLPAPGKGGKSKAMSQLQQQRQTIGTVSGRN
ncbi:MAG: hypothetical protein U9O78_00440 [Patescibacteria group bacterium]|nr:hypothetical protein [Patescibacteria group bacterium]